MIVISYDGPKLKFVYGNCNGFRLINSSILVSLNNDVIKISDLSDYLSDKQIITLYNMLKKEYEKYIMKNMGVCVIDVSEIIKDLLND